MNRKAALVIQREYRKRVLGPRRLKKREEELKIVREERVKLTAQEEIKLASDKPTVKSRFGSINYLTKVMHLLFIISIPSNSAPPPFGEKIVELHVCIAKPHNFMM